MAGARSTARGGARGLYAAVDLGTTNCRLLIARPAPGGFRVLESFSRNVRLGDGLDETGRLSDAAMARAIEALGICAERIRRANVVRARAIATAACRRARNGGAFAARVRRETGLNLEIVSAKEEARLAVAGCRPLLDPKSDGAIVFDIGGGSTELVWLVFGRDRTKGVDARLANWISLPIGVVTLADRCRGLPFPEIAHAMSREIAAALDQCPAAETLSPVFREGRFHFMGTSGTVTTLSAIHLGLTRYDRSKVDAAWVPVAPLIELCDLVGSSDHDGRAAIPCIGEDRAELILPGALLLSAICRRWTASRLRVADRGLREGVLLALMYDRGGGGNGGGNSGRRRRRRKGAGPNGGGTRNAGTGGGA